MYDNRKIEIEEEINGILTDEDRYYWGIGTTTDTIDAMINKYNIGILHISEDECEIVRFDEWCDRCSNKNCFFKQDSLSVEYFVGDISQEVRERCTGEVDSFPAIFVLEYIMHKHMYDNKSIKEAVQDFFIMCENQSVKGEL